MIVCSAMSIRSPRSHDKLGVFNSSERGTSVRMLTSNFSSPSFGTCGIVLVVVCGNFVVGNGGGKGHFGTGNGTSLGITGMSKGGALADFIS